mgnify:CR=1 FL=1
MRTIKLNCDEFGKVYLQESSIFSQENEEIEIEITYPSEFSSYRKRLDIFVSNDRSIDFVEEDTDVLTVTLTSEHTKRGVIKLQPIAYVVEVGVDYNNSNKQKWQTVRFDVAYSINASESTVNVDKTLGEQLQENIDVHSQYIIVSTIELLLNYCSRFYGRQMITRSQTNKSIIAQIENILTNYFVETQLKEQGLPTVKFLADNVHLSPSYLSDLLKKETGKNTQEHIHFYLIEQAKNYLKNTEKNINEIAYILGFEYPQYFNKLFKQKTGNTPMEYRNLN